MSVILLLRVCSQELNRLFLPLASFDKLGVQLVGKDLVSLSSRQAVHHVLHAASGVIWSAPRGENVKKIKNKTRTPGKNRLHGPLAHWEAVARSRPQQEK